MCRLTPDRNRLYFRTNVPNLKGETDHSPPRSSTVSPCREIFMDEQAHKIDRRKERTQRLLRDAFMELIVEKGYDAVTILDITERANVARPTFYLHYNDKEDLLFKMMTEVYDDLSNSVEKQTTVNGLLPDGTP